jgi:hypothetical protein
MFFAFNLGLILYLYYLNFIMKKVITSVSVLFFSAHILAQETKPVDAPATFKHEIGLNLFSITNIGIPGETVFHVVPDNIYGFTNVNLPSGIYYKLHSGKNALRLSYDYFQRSYTESEYVDLSKYIIDGPNSPIAYTYTYAGVKKEHEFKIGYQRTIGTKRFTGFFALDLVANYNKFQGTNQYLWHPEERYYTSPFYYEQYKAGIALGGGLKYKITKRLSISYELSLAGIYTRSKDIAYSGNQLKTEVSAKLNPVRMIGIGYSF